MAFCRYTTPLILVVWGLMLQSTKISASADGSDFCPAGMALVSSEAKQIRVCVDKYEFSGNDGNLNEKYQKPQGYFSLPACRQICENQGKRLLSQKEWQTACRGTKQNKCNIFAKHPVIRMLRRRQPWIYKGLNCKKQRNTWMPTCMSDPRLNKHRPGLAANGAMPECVSEYGIFNMVGNLGEWVSDIRNDHGIKKGRFSGGLYPQTKSSCSYSTISHTPHYSDYSIGCRCGKTPDY